MTQFRQGFGLSSKLRRQLIQTVSSGMTATSPSLCACNMATRAAAMKRLPIVPLRSAFTCSTASRRTFTTLQLSPRVANSRAKVTTHFLKPTLQQSFRRSYAEVITPTAKRRGRGFFRWTWRLIYLSAIAGTGWLAYNIYVLRTPQEQFEPDPSKKTLVILGTHILGRTPNPLWNTN